jgi:hypothetical protein
MTEPLGVTACELRATASDLAEVSSRMKPWTPEDLR